MPRKLPSFLPAYQSLMADKPTPPIFSEWAALATISGALERRCVFRGMAAKNQLFPNLYVLLVGYPGVGKSLAIDPAVSLWRATKLLRVAPVSVSGKGFFDAMAEATQGAQLKAFQANSRQPPYTSMLIGLSEFGTFLHEYDHTLISFLNEMFDCGDVVEDRTRGKGAIEVQNPHVVLLGGTQPGYLAEIFPPVAFEMGLARRIIFVWGEKPKERLAVFRTSQTNTGEVELFSSLLSDLRHICTLVGEFTITPVAREIIQAWSDGGEKPLPQHPKLKHYNESRLMHLVKMAMCFSVSERDDLRVEDSHVMAALDLLLRTEENMAKIFSAMGQGGDSDRLHEIQQVLAALARDRPELSKQDVVRVLMARMKIQEILPTLNSLVQSGFLVENIAGNFQVRLQ